MLDYLIGAKRRTGNPARQPRGPQDHRYHRDGPKVAETNGLKCYDTFTGFKFLAEKKESWRTPGPGQGDLRLRGEHTAT